MLKLFTELFTYLDVYIRVGMGKIKRYSTKTFFRVFMTLSTGPLRSSKLMRDLYKLILDTVWFGFDEHYDGLLE